MVAPWLSTLASVGMAIGPPLASLCRPSVLNYQEEGCNWLLKRCLCHTVVLIAFFYRVGTYGMVRLIANITRCFFWLGNRFELALLFQSIFMIIAQLGLLYICILYRPKFSPEAVAGSSRPFSFWQWTTYTQYIEFLVALLLCHTILFLIFGRSEVFVSILGFAALGLESTLPLPQLISNYKQRSLYGFRMSTLLGWVGGDSFKTVYFFLQHSPLPFRVCAIFQLSIDFAILIQRVLYGNAPPMSVLLEEEDELEQALALND